MLDYESAAINRYTRTFRDPELEKGYLEDRWEKNKKFIWTVVVVAHLLFIPIIGDDIKQLGPEFSDVPITYFIPHILSTPITWALILREDDLSSTLNIGQANKPKSVIYSLLSSKFSL